MQPLHPHLSCTVKVNPKSRAGAPNDAIAWIRPAAAEVWTSIGDGTSETSRNQKFYLDVEVLPDIGAVDRL